MRLIAFSHSSTKMHPRYAKFFELSITATVDPHVSCRCLFADFNELDAKHMEIINEDLSLVHDCSCFQRACPDNTNGNFRRSH